MRKVWMVTVLDGIKPIAIDYAASKSVAKIVASHYRAENPQHDILIHKASVYHRLEVNDWLDQQDGS